MDLISWIVRNWNFPRHSFPRKKGTTVHLYKSESIVERWRGWCSIGAIERFPISLFTVSSRSVPTFVPSARRLVTPKVLQPLILISPQAFWHALVHHVCVFEYIGRSENHYFFVIYVKKKKKISFDKLLDQRWFSIFFFLQRVLN